jgi:CheY-like chemotaxis protein
VEGEKGALQRLILILLQHAEKSLSRHEGEKRLIVRTRETNSGAVIYVCDSGPGVPRQNLPSVLESDVFPESGLGLNTADLIARELGGSFWIESGEGKGTTFTVRLPRATVPRQVQFPRVVRPVQPPRGGSGVRVLVADDEPTLRLALSMFLGRHGYEVDQAEDVEQALKMFASREYDVAFVDVRMPGDGLALLARLDDLPDWHGHAILMTGDQTQPRIREELRGGRPHLIKPFDMMDAVRMIESVRREPRIVRQPGVTTWTSS